MAGETPAPDNVRWILFDAVGTLIYPDPPVAEAYHAAACDFGSRLGIEKIASRFRAAFAAELGGNAGSEGSLSRPPTSEAHERQRWQRIVSRVIDDVTGPAAAMLFDRLWNHFAQPHHWQLFDDVAPTLTDLAARGFRLGIASNFDCRLHNILAGHPPLRRCEAVFVSSALGFTKPDPRFFAAVTQQLGVLPDQILLIGDDQVNDVVGANAAGWRTVLLDRTRRECRKSTIDSLMRIPEQTN